MKSLARLTCYWPSLNLDMQRTISTCQACYQKPKRSDWNPWPSATCPMQRIHIDYCDPLLGKYYALVIIDCFSRFPEIFLTTNASATFTQQALQKFFAREGIAQCIVSDNGTHFTSSDLKSWLK